MDVGLNRARLAPTVPMQGWPSEDCHGQPKVYINKQACTDESDSGGWVRMELRNGNKGQTWPKDLYLVPSEEADMMSSQRITP